MRLSLCAGPIALWFILLCVACVSAQPAQARMPCAGLSLVLAMDGSGSMSEEDFRLQMQATAVALQHPEVLAVIAAVGGIAVATIVWADSTSGIQRLDWDFVHDGPSAARHARRMAGLRRSVSGNTDMGHGLWAALDMLAVPENCAARRIVNVSGDGRETPHARGRSAVSVAAARSRALAEGVMINGLAITAEDAGLRDWYERAVIAGNGSFAMAVSGIEDYAAAMRAKLLREIGGAVMTAALPVRAAPGRMAAVFPARPRLLPAPPG